MADNSYSATNPTSTTLDQDITVAAEVGPMVPVGMVLPYAGSGDPIGYLCCDGRAVSRTTYAALFAVIGTTYGSGNGSTTFNIPNLVARFVEGSTTSGTVKQAGLPNITGQIVDSNDLCSYPSLFQGAFQYQDATSAGREANDKDGKSVARTTFDASRCSAVYGRSTTVQPASVTMRQCIRY